MQPIIEIDDVHKQYLLGNFGYGTLRHDLQSWFSRIRGKEDPNAKIDGRPMGDNEEFWALKGVSLSVYPGDTIGIVGRNGSGKSTLFKILSRLTAPTKGEVRINGTMASLLEVGTGFHPDLTGRENIFLNGTILGLRKRDIELKLDEIVAFSEVSQFIDTPVKRYSSGMYVRLAFSIAAHLDSEILLLDEVLAVGDESFRMKCLAKMQEISRSGRTILFVSHSQAQVETLCRRAVLLSEGRILLEGTTAEVFQKYAAFTAH